MWKGRSPKSKFDGLSLIGRKCREYLLQIIPQYSADLEARNSTASCPVLYGRSAYGESLCQLVDVQEKRRHLSSQFAADANSCRRQIASLRRSTAFILRCPQGCMMPNRATSVAPAWEHIAFRLPQGADLLAIRSRLQRGRPVSRQESAHLFLHLPGPAPNERRRAAASRFQQRSRHEASPFILRRLSDGCHFFGRGREHEA